MSSLETIHIAKRLRQTWGGSKGHLPGFRLRVVRMAAFRCIPGFGGQFRLVLMSLTDRIDELQ